MASKKAIEAKEFLELLKNKPELKKNIIDIRTPKEVKIYGKFTGSLIIEQRELQKTHGKILTKKGTYFVISQDGEGAKTLVSALRMFRRYDAIYIIGGYKAIIDARIGKE